jgi:hypothetical protein
MPRFLELIILLLIFAVIFLGFSHIFRRKRQFRSIKKKYGIVKDKLHDIETITALFLRFNEMSDRPIGFDDYTTINIGGASILLCYGNVGYKTSIWWEGVGPFSPTAVFLVVERKDFGEIVLNRRDLFEFAMQKEDISIFLVRDLKKLDSYLGRQQRLNSAHIN